jgi:hypothetical protein
MSEADAPKKTTLAQASADAMAVDTMGGRMHVRWDETAQATPHGQIVFFAEFLSNRHRRADEGAELRAFSGPQAALYREIVSSPKIAWSEYRSPLRTSACPGAAAQRSKPTPGAAPAAHGGTGSVPPHLTSLSVKLV